MTTRVSVRDKIAAKAAAPPPPPSTTIDVDDLLASTTKKKDKAKPRVETDARIDQLAAEYLKFKEAEKEAKKMADIRRDDVVALVRPSFYQACEQKGESLSSINAGKVKVTFTSNYSAIPYDERDRLVEAFGEEFDRYFREETEFKIKTNDAVAFMKELIALVGVEFYKEHFESKRVLKVNPVLHDDINTKPAVRAQVQPLIENGIVAPYAPSIKLA